MNVRTCIVHLLIVAALSTAALPSLFVVSATLAEAQSTAPASGAGGSNTDATKETTTSCWTSWTSVPDIGCFVRSTLSILGAIPAAIGAWTLTVSGILFNWLIYYTIIIFGDVNNGFLTKGVVDGINLVWTVFRDIANIIIIGMFAFVAISIILGNQKYGDKKLIARVLIVAILINFSLLFTKVIVDASNFVALQFYKAVDLPANEGGTFSVTQGQSQQTQAGIAGRFIQHMGITSVGNVYAAVDKVAVNQNVGIAILYGLFVGTIFIAAAAVFLYGSFLLISRAILILFLMMTASLAFASYLIPSLAEGSYGWGTWWKSLINVSIFAPLLMMFLWATLTISEAFAKGSGGSLGKLVSDPTSSFDMKALFGYLIVLGLLFASIKISSAFSTKISGFNFAAMIPALGLAGGARIAAFAGRQTIGRASQAGSDALTRRGANARPGSVAQSLYTFGSNSLKGIAKSDMNAMRTPVGSVVAKVSGIDAKALAGKEVKGFDGTQQARAKKFAENADMLHVDEKKHKKLTDTAVNDELAKNPELKERHTDASQALDLHQQKLVDAERGQTAAMENMTKTVKDAQQRVDSASTDDERSTAQTELDRTRAEHQTQIEEQTGKITRAKKDIETAKGAVAHVENVAKENAIAGGKLKREYMKEADLAATIAHNRFTNTLARFTGWNDIGSDALAQRARKEVGEHHEQKEAKKIMKYLKEKTDGGSAAAPTPAAAPSAPSHAPSTPPAAAGGDDHGGGGHH